MSSSRTRKESGARYAARDERAASALNNGPYHPQRYQGVLPPPSPHGHQSKYNAPMMYGYHHSNTQTMPSQHQLQSVVTTSFSVEEERDESRSVEHRQGAMDIRGARTHEIHGQTGWNSVPDREEGRHQHHQDYSNTAEMSPSTRTSSMGRPPFIHRAYSTGHQEYFTQPESMKRSFFHHAPPSDSYSGGQLPAEFMPPKRAKMTPSTNREMMPSPQREIMPSPQREMMPSLQREMMPSPQREMMPSPQRQHHDSAE
jgi:hypothetical protein